MPGKSSELGDRRAIFQNLSRSLAKIDPDDTIERRRICVAERFASPVELPAGSAIGREIKDNALRFVAAAERVGATVSRASTSDELICHLTQACRGDDGGVHGVYAASSGDERLEQLLADVRRVSAQDGSQNHAENILTLVQREAISPLTLIAYADLGIAESGSVVFRSNGRVAHRWNVLASKLVVVLDEASIVWDYEAVDRHLVSTAAAADNHKQWSMSWITGPSLTGDIEQTLTRGAHGPLALHIALYRGEA